MKTTTTPAYIIHYQLVTLTMPFVVEVNNMWSVITPMGQPAINLTMSLAKPLTAMGALVDASGTDHTLMVKWHLVHASTHIAEFAISQQAQYHLTQCGREIQDQLKTLGKNPHPMFRRAFNLLTDMSIHCEHAIFQYTLLLSLVDN